MRPFLSPFTSKRQKGAGQKGTKRDKMGIKTLKMAKNDKNQLEKGQ